jgi:hypothetical protein
MIGNGSPVTGDSISDAISRPFEVFTMQAGQGILTVDLPAGGDFLVVATDQQDVVSNEFAWARFRTDPPLEGQAR